MFKRFGSQILRTVFRVQPGEGVRVGVMLIYSLAAVGGVIITGQLVSCALFLSNLQPCCSNKARSKLQLSWPHISTRRTICCAPMSTRLPKLPSTS